MKPYEYEHMIVEKPEPERSQFLLDSRPSLGAPLWLWEGWSKRVKRVQEKARLEEGAEQ